MDETEKKYEVGDLVALPSSEDVKMTVVEIDEVTNRLTVMWLDEKQRIQRTTIPSNAVIMA